MSESFRLLILEDNPTDAELMKFELEEAGLTFTLKVVTTEQAYIQAIEDFHPDLILSDYDLPTYNGASALAAANRRCPETPFILVTGAVTEDRAIDILTQGAKDYVLKARLKQRLIPAVRRALAEAAEHRARTQAEEELRIAHRELEERVRIRTAQLQEEIERRKLAESRIEADLAALTRIHDLSSRLVGIEGIQPLLQEIMDTAVTVANAPKGTLQLLEGDSLRLVAHCGHRQPFLEFFAAAENRASVCGEATKQGDRVIVPDVEKSTLFAGTDSLGVLRDAGVRSVQSTPIIARSGKLLGILTTQWNIPHQPDEHDLWRIDLLVRQAADLIESAKGREDLLMSERRARERAMELEALLEAAPTPIFIAYDSECRHLAGNRAAEDLLGVPHGSETSLSAPASVRPRHFKAVKEGRELRNEELPAQRAARGIPVRDFEFSLVFDDGDTRDVLGYGTPLYNEEGQPRGAVHVLIDITDRKRAEMAARAEQDHLRMALEAAGMVIWELDIPTRSILYSDNLPNIILGTEVKPYCSLVELMPLIHPEDRDRLDQALERASKEGIPFECEYRVRMLDGAYRWILGKGKRVVMEAGKPVRVLGLSLDITERKRTEQEFRESEKRFRALVMASSEVLYIMSPDWSEMRRLHSRGFLANTEKANPGWLEEYIQPDEQPRVIAAIREAIRTKGIFKLEHRVKRTDGSNGWVLSRAVPLMDANGEIVEWFGSANDITELHKKASQLEAANRELESFSYSVSHDLRAPLRAIDGYSRMILKREGHKFDENTRRQFDQIIKYTRMMEQLIDGLLALSRLGKEALSLSTLEMADLTRDVWEDLRANNPVSPIDFKINPVPTVKGDRLLIKQALNNLLSNAIKFSRTRDVPFIEVGGYSAERENVYYVRDNGVGFDMRYYDRLFGIFKSLHSAADYEGTGIGLAIVQRIILRHGGRVWAESEVDKGATFYFTLPTQP